MAATAVAIPSAPRTGTWFGHPKGLFILFFTEMWERFSYYGMRSLLVLYMVNYLFIRPDVGQHVLGFTAMRAFIEHLPWVNRALDIQPLSSQVYGLYTGFVYLTPFFGGMLADRVLGQRKTVVLGGLLMAAGHFLMANEHMFLPALMLIIAGNGAFKPNISTQVGLLYPPGDPRRDGAFTIFYIGINLGAFFAPLVCGTLGQTVGWHYGFAAAGVGMLLGLALYLFGQKHLAEDALQTRRAEAVPVKEKMTREEWMRVGVLLVICALNVVFWGVYEQQGNTMQLWADRNTNWHMFGFNVPSTWYQAFNPAMIFLFAPLLAAFWGRQAARGKEPSSLWKMGFGCTLVGLSFLIMVLATQGMEPDARRSVLWLVGMTVIVTIGELYLSPVGLSFVTKVAPIRMVSMLMGVWFLANFLGNYLTGYLGTFWETMAHGRFFLLLSGLGVGAGVIMLLLSRPLDRIVSKHDRGLA